MSSAPASRTKSSPAANGGSASSPVSSPADRAVRAVERFARAEGLFRRPGRVLAAVSGGPDSVACLLLLLRLRERFGLDLLAAHFDHGLRDTSKQDLDFVRDLCARLDVECFTGEGDVRQAAAGRRMGIEEAARRMRYQFLGFVAGKERAGAVVTGHTRDDQVETVLLRILRGTGVRGLRGILPAAPLPGAPSLLLVRPLLALTRVDTEAICAEAGVEPRRDPMNADVAFSRSRVRHETLPLLQGTNPSVGDALLGLAASARELFDRVERETFKVQPQVREPWGSIFALPALAALPNEGVAAVLEREAAFHRSAVALNRTRLNNLRAVLRRGSGRVPFGGLEVEVSCGLVRTGPPGPPPEPLVEKLLEVPGRTLAPGWLVEVAIEPLGAAPGALLAALPTSGQRGALRVRSPRPGDRVVLRGVERNLADALTNAKVPRWARRRLLVVADAVSVRAVLGAPASFANLPGEDVLYLRAAPQAPAGR